MAISCDPNNLASLARCLTCLPAATLQEVKTNLLCQLNSVGGFGTNIVPPGSTYTGALAEFDLTVVANTGYIIVWGSNELYMIMCGQRFDSTGAGTITVVFTGACTVMQFFGTFAGTTVTARVKVINLGNAGTVLPTPTAFAQTINAAGAQVTYTWTIPFLAYLTATEVWTSTDNINFTLNSTITKPTATAVLSTPAVGTTLYTKIRFIGNVTASAFTTPLAADGRVADWVKRVNTNGGTTPASLTLDALSDFVSDMRAASLESKMISMIPLVPDNLIAAITPLYKVAGNDPWTNVGPFVAADLTVNGLIGDGVSKVLSSGVTPSAQWNIGAGPNGGITIYTITALKDLSGAPDAAVQNGAGNNAFDLYLNNNGTMQFACYNQTTDRLQQAVATPFAGFFSANASTPSRRDVFIASSTQAFTSFLSSSAAIGGVLPAGPCAFLGYFIIPGPNHPGPVRRHSFDAIHNGYTAAEAQNLYNAVQKYRMALLGGFV